MQNTAEVQKSFQISCFAGGRVKGSVIRPHIDWVRDHGDRAEVIEFFHEIRPTMRVVSAASWYSFEDLIVLDRTIVNRLGNGDPRCMEHVGRYAAQQALARAKRSRERSGIQGYLGASAAQHRETHDFGNAIYCEFGEAEGQLIRAGWNSFSPLYCTATVGFYREIVRLHGGVDVEVWESACRCRGDESCIFEMVWS